MSDALHQLHEERLQRLRRMQEKAIPEPPPPPERPPPELPTWRRCVALVAENYKRRIGRAKEPVPIEVGEILSNDRVLAIVRARQLAIYLTRKSSRMSTPQIGRKFRRTHATVLHSIAKIEEIMDKKPGAREEIERLLALVRPEAPCPTPLTPSQTLNTPNSA